jgi:uncharacterized short protein YbdD (DUF466 family)
MNREYRQMGASARRIGFGLKSAALACGPRSRWEALRLAIGKIGQLWRRTVQSARPIMAGVPAYEVYIAHQRTHHPAEPLMSYADFFRERERARYACEKGHFGGCC